MIQLGDEHRERIRERFPGENIRDGGPVRKPNPTRRALEAVRWCRNQVLRNRLSDLANTLRDEGGLDETKSFIDATFAWAKGGGEGIGPTKRGKGASVVHVTERRSMPEWIGG